MKIIDKQGKKDYYDYLSGIYGEDPNIVLDRRTNENFTPISPQKIVLFICGKRIEGFFDGKDFHYGESLINFFPKGTNIHRRKHYYDSMNPDNVHIEYENEFDIYRAYVNIKINDDDQHLNEKENCPILVLGYMNQIVKYPRLDKFNLGSFLSPEIIYQMLVDWLSYIKTKSENKPDNRTDVEKLLSKGFDKIESFRPKIKVK